MHETSAAPRKKDRRAAVFFYCSVLLPEVAVQQTLEGLAVAGFVMNVTEKPSNINTFFKNPTWLDTIFVL